MSANKDAPIVFLQASTNSDAKERLDLNDRLISFEFVDSEKRANQCFIELDNFDLSLYELEGLRRGSIISVAWGYAGNMSPTHEMTIRRSTSSSFKIKRKKGDPKSQYAKRDKTVSSDSGGDSIKGFEIFKLEAYGKSFAMHQDIKSRVFENTTRSEVVRRIAAEYGFINPAFIHVEDTDETYAIITQARMTDAQFLKRLAAKEGFEFYTDWDGFHFHTRQTQQAAAKVFRYYTDQNAGEVAKVDEIDVNLAGLGGAITCAGYDPIQKKEIRERATNDNVKRATLAPDIELISPEDSTTRLMKRNVADHVIATPQATKASARREADGRFRDAQLAAVKVKLTIIGDPTVLAKTICDIEGIGSLFNGKYYISEARHKISDGGFLVSLHTRRDGLNKGTPSKGSLNRTDAKKDAITPFEAINPETSTTQVQFRDTKGRTVGIPGLVGPNRPTK